MPGLDWNDLRVVLAVSRASTLTEAARRLRVDPTTVARRLRFVEAALGSCLFERLSGGALAPTRSGRAAIEQAEMMEGAVLYLLQSISGSDSSVAGSVRVTTVPLLANRVLIPGSVALVSAYPALRLEIVGEARSLNLTRREADIALRLARPTADAGAAVKAQKVGLLSYAAYTRADCPPGEEAVLPWIVYEDGTSDPPQARWLAEAARSSAAAPVSTNDAEALLQAVKSGLGRTLLPTAVGDGEPGLRRISPKPGSSPLPSRELWLLTRPEVHSLARITIVVRWLKDLAAGLAGERVRDS